MQEELARAEVQSAAALQAVKQQTKANGAKQKRIKAAQKEASEARYTLHCVLHNAMSGKPWLDQAVFALLQAEQLSFATWICAYAGHTLS